MCCCFFVSVLLVARSIWRDIYFFILAAMVTDLNLNLHTRAHTCASIRLAGRALLWGRESERWWRHHCYWLLFGNALLVNSLARINDLLAVGKFSPYLLRVTLLAAKLLREVRKQQKEHEKRNQRKRFGTRPRAGKSSRPGPTLKPRVVELLSL